MASTDDKLVLTAEQAIALLPDGEYVHNFAQGGMALIGCDYSREDAISALNAASLIEMAGPSAMALEHPIATWDPNDRLTFFAADMDRVEAMLADRVPA